MAIRFASEPMPRPKGGASQHRRALSVRISDIAERYLWLHGRQIPDQREPGRKDKEGVIPKEAAV
ncbi:MAG: hypothetical protein JJU13_11615 [Balneolaceae bacterium]|nr:hypothetical protein [Balneolaceae bacterium]